MNDVSSDQLRVLVVDDDELNQRMMRLILTREGHDVQIAVNGMDALRAVDEHDFDIILMDLQMPMMDGIEASRRIRSLENGKRNAYIVALTASYLPEKGQELFEAGIDNYIAKPFDVEHLRQMLEHGLDRRKLKVVVADGQNEVQSASVIWSFDAMAGIRMVGGDAEVYRELLADFVGRLPQKNELIELYFLEKNMRELARVAHNIKGISSSLGALQLSEHADRLEKSVGEGYTGESVEILVRETIGISRKFMADASIYLDAASDREYDL